MTFNSMLSPSSPPFPSASFISHSSAIYAGITRVQVTLSKDLLKQEMRVTNTGLSPLEFTTALHTYFRVSNITQASLSPGFTAVLNPLLCRRLP